MSEEPGIGTIVAPVAVWLVGVAVITVVSIEHILEGPEVIRSQARFAAYLSASFSVAFSLGLVVLFGLACAGMLWWLDHPLPAHQIVGIVGTAFWVVTAFAWAAGTMLVFSPPAVISTERLLEPGVVEVLRSASPALRTLEASRPIATGGFLLASFILLTRKAGVGFAALAVGFGAALIAFLASMLARLSGMGPL